MPPSLVWSSSPPPQHCSEKDWCQEAKCLSQGMGLEKNESLDQKWISASEIFPMPQAHKMTQSGLPQFLGTHPFILWVNVFWTPAVFPAPASCCGLNGTTKKIWPLSSPILSQDKYVNLMATGINVKLPLLFMLWRSRGCYKNLREGLSQVNFNPPLPVLWGKSQLQRLWQEDFSSSERSQKVSLRHQITAEI